MKVLLVEDERITRITLSKTLRNEGYEVLDCENGVQAIAAIKERAFDVVVTDLRLPGASGLDVLKTVQSVQADCPVIVMTAYASVDTAVEALKNGAYDYLTKPFSPETLLARLGHFQKIRDIEDENKELKKRLLSFEKRVIIGTAPETNKLLELIRMVANTDAPVLIQGESGTGKELVARSLHELSDRAGGPFVPVNCAAIPENLFESELFGHEKGSFSGAHRQHKGYFERANGGTIFIDDIDDFPLTLQVKLLRVLQEHELERVGGHKLLRLDIRVLAASKVDLWHMVEQKAFREDLYYRLDIVPITVPPLRNRLGDLPLLVDHFLDKYGASPLAISKATSMMDQFMTYHWPGNIRQLENMVQRIVAIPELSHEGVFRGRRRSPNSIAITDPENKTFPSYKDFMEQKDREILEWALKRSQHNTSRAAKLLDLPRSTLRSKLDKYDISGDEDT